MLTVADRLPNMLLYLEIWPSVSPDCLAIIIFSW